MTDPTVWSYLLLFLCTLDTSKTVVFFTIQRSPRTSTSYKFAAPRYRLPSKLTSFRAILAVRRHAAVRAEGLLAQSSTRFSVNKRCRSFVHAWRKGLGSLLSYPLLVAKLCFNPAEGPQTASRSAECRPAELPYVLLDLRIYGGPPNVDFTLTLRLVHV